jgi:hypothetical protein
MAQANLVCNPLLLEVEESILVMDILCGVVRNVFSLGSSIKLRNSGRVGHRLVGFSSLSHSAQGG